MDEIEYYRTAFFKKLDDDGPVQFKIALLGMGIESDAIDKVIETRKLKSMIGM